MKESSGQEYIKTIKDIAIDVYDSLGSGHPEVVYDRAMQVGFRLAKIRYDSQKVVEVMYKNHYVGEGYPDLIAHFEKEKILIELKAIGGTIGPAEEKQLQTYMKYLKIGRGVLINFQQPKKTGTSTLEFKVLEP
jgi:GxxExxY protein